MYSFSSTANLDCLLQANLPQQATSHRIAATGNEVLPIATIERGCTALAKILVISALVCINVEKH